jgi:parallel beta-helix repeat protein
VFGSSLAFSLFYWSDSNYIINNSIEQCSTGISISGYSNGNTIANNALQSNSYSAITISEITEINLINNTMDSGGILFDSSGFIGWSSDSIISSNFFNDKPIVFWIDQQGGKVPLGAGQIILINCTNIIVEDQYLNDTTDGIQMIFGRSILIANNTIISNQRYGINILESSNNTIINNLIMNNGESGISLSSYSSFLKCENNTIENNNISNNNFDGIYLYSTEGNVIRNNQIFFNKDTGISFRSCQKAENTVIGNTIIGNSWNGVEISSANYVKITNNLVSHNGNSGLALRDSNDNIIMNNTIRYNSENGVGLYGVFSSLFFNNSASENYVGLNISDSSNNIITKNYLTMNSFGIYLISSSSNRILKNNFILNSDNYAEFSTKNQWYDEYPQGGNFWSGHDNVDQLRGSAQDLPGKDGIADSAYILPGDNNSFDMYPLTAPIKMSLSDLDFFTSTPLAPNNLNTRIGKGYIILSWSEPVFHGVEPITKYNIYRGTEQGNETLLISIDNPTITEFLDTGVIDGETYYYRVSAENNMGHGPEATVNTTTPVSKSSSNSQDPDSMVIRYLLLTFFVIFLILFLIVRAVTRRRIHRPQTIRFASEPDQSIARKSEKTLLTNEKGEQKQNQ